MSLQSFTNISLFSLFQMRKVNNGIREQMARGSFVHQSATQSVSPGFPVLPSLGNPGGRVSTVSQLVKFKHFPRRKNLIT
uniref:Uncharacterized protein n=1 Tax=Mesocestoides corti TaxID=53468 RepID=A0A5K3F9F1_MESCO